MWNLYAKSSFSANQRHFLVFCKMCQFISNFLPPKWEFLLSQWSSEDGWPEFSGAREGAWSQAWEAALPLPLLLLPPPSPRSWEAFGGPAVSPPLAAVYQHFLEQPQGQETILDMSFYINVYLPPVVSSFSYMAVLEESEVSNCILSLFSK